MSGNRLPEDESERLAALHGYDILDTLPEEDYDAIARLAAHVCGTPMALINLIDSDRGWFKARVGVDEPELPRPDVMCATAILEPDRPLVIEDLTRDERFDDNRLVVDAPALRFYAGSPLVTPDGHALGTICVLDTEPRRLEPHQVELLTDLGRQVAAQLELRRAVRELEAARREAAAARERAEEADRAKGEFLSRMSHELRTPLNAILGFGQLLETDPDLGDEQRADLASIVSAGRHLLALVDELLDVSRSRAPSRDRPRAGSAASRFPP
ncbi:MAG TPA: histidine kinase dimerization/phospho-acceptor domain-containing protein [Solirubrobacteraceae bacterium]